ncbi:proton-conducting transporter membrane subunit [Pseudovibrio sp. Tun.PSC04-5.I4]|uniref:proton-conducting transporter transmembrane domain-containing protein n=1 Tax=Pseudovibrio sp. Tun.PSC04-5.I4 TaxID=1798213 RepID=UPI000884706D|nr:proton-conducting transporter membrane subunit [Pseudovibrio sp. Tun.PSC04-5.I4]SDQ12224.1 Formate hydrogenlyase subunit 3/Multisubunit Na+/H+ antiporter, MnhD subunit [Pseudovibrio sp. Tun.PSC04-5.I4]
MHVSEPSLFQPIMAYLGVTILMLGEIAALLVWRDLKRVLVLSTIAEIGFALIGFALSETGELGGGMHIVYQSIMRLLVIVVAARMAAKAGGWQLKDLRGAGRTTPLYGVLFAFGMFSLLGLSPFKGAMSRFLIVNELVAGGYWVLAVCATLASILASIYAIRLIQGICFANPVNVSSPKTQSGTGIWLVSNAVLLVLGALTALMNFFPEPVAEIAAVIFQLTARMPHVEGPWPMLSTLPYAGAFVILALGFISTRARDGVAITLAIVTLGIVATATGVDPLSYLFALLFAAVMVAVTIYSVAYMSHEGDTRLYFFFLFLMSGSLIGLAVAEDLGSFYLFWELMTWSSYLLIVQTRSEEALAAGQRYFIMCVGGAYVMLLGIVWLGLEAGGFSFEAVYAHAAALDTTTATMIGLLLFTGFAVKAGLVPLHSWLPVAHPAAPSPVSAPLSSILTKTGMLGTFKLIVLGLALVNLPRLGLTISLIGVLSLLYGEIMAWRQTDLKRMLAYSTIAQVGEIMALIGLATTLSATAGLAHILTHGFMKTLLFLGAGALIYRAGSRQISDLAGIGRSMPVSAVMLTVGLLAIMGLPPFAGFYSKFMMIYASMDAGMPVIAASLLLGGVIGVLYYGRLIRVILFDKVQETSAPVSAAPLLMQLPLVVLAAALVVSGLAPEYFLGLATEAGQWVTGAKGVALTLDVTWPLAAITCAVGAIVIYVLGRRSDTLAGVLAVLTMVGAILALYIERAQFGALSLGFVVIVTGLGLLNILHTIGYFQHHGHRIERFLASFILMIGGLIGMARADDLFSFFFFWEIMSSWTLYFAIIHDETKEALQEGFKYFLFNMIGASFLFFGVAMLAVGAQALDFDSVRAAAQTMPLWQLGLGLGSVLLGVAMKAAMLTVRVDYQMHPATAPTPVSGYISAVLLKSGPLFAFKFLFLIGTGVLASRFGVVSGLDPFSYSLAIIGAVTALYAGMMAVIQTGIKRLLVYSTVAQLGYVMCALSLGDSLSVAGGLAHLANHALLKNTLFLAAGVILAQAHVTSLDDLGGLAKRMPITFAMFLFAGLSLSGMPPFNGLGSKWLIYEGAMLSGHPFIALMLMGASLTTLAAILKFAHAAFMGAPSPQSEKMSEASWTMLAPMLAMNAMSLMISIFPGLLLVPVSRLQAAMGLEPVQATWFGPLPGLYGWHPLALMIPLLAVMALGWSLMKLSGLPVRRVHAHTCGVDIRPHQTRVAAGNLYATPDRLIRKVLFVRGDGK